MPFGRESILRMGEGDRLYVDWTESGDIAVTPPNGIQYNTVTHPLTPIPLVRQEIELYVEGYSDWYRERVLEANLAGVKPSLRLISLMISDAFG